MTASFPAPPPRPPVEEPAPGRSDALARRLASTAAATRLALGEAFEALRERCLFHELGFSSLSAYVLERSGRSARWAAESRALARKLHRLRWLRNQVVCGALSWSRAEILSKLIEQSLPNLSGFGPHASLGLRRALERCWFFKSEGQTCLAMSEQLRTPGIGAPCDGDNDEDPQRCLSFTVSHEDSWWFHAAECTFRRLGATRSLDALLEALLAETQNTLTSDTVTLEEEGYHARDRLREFLNCWHIERERFCESSRPKTATNSVGCTDLPSPEELRTWSAPALDRHIVTLSRRLAVRDLDLGRAAELVRPGRGWRQLGFASEAHYAREGLGISMSSLKQKRALARRLLKLPRLARALSDGHIGSVAAALVARVATPSTEGQWVERARQRTVKHLREEVALIERALLQHPGQPGLPPRPDTVDAALALEGAIASGRHSVEPGSPLHHQDTALLQTTATPSQPHGQTSGGENAARRPPIGDGLSLGKVRLKLRVRESTVLLYRDVSQAFELRYPGKPFLRSICQHFLEVWQPVLRRDRKYEAIYERDGYTCSSPVCERHDVTPHHLRFRSRGGGEEPGNLAALCVWCHLEGIHAGRLEATPDSNGLHWRIGRPAILHIVGRDKQVQQ